MERLSAVASAASSLPERSTMAAAAAACVGFVSWDEVFVSSDRGRREVHYHLKRSDGSSDLAVVGKEKSLRHMSYHYALQNRFLSSVGLFSSLTKLKSRREVVEWLSSVVSGTTLPLVFFFLLWNFHLGVPKFLLLFSSTFFWFCFPLSFCLPVLVSFFPLSW